MGSSASQYNSKEIHDSELAAENSDNSNTDSSTKEMTDGEHVPEIETKRNESIEQIVKEQTDGNLNLSIDGKPIDLVTLHHRNESLEQIVNEQTDGNLNFSIDGDIVDLGTLQQRIQIKTKTGEVTIKESKEEIMAKTKTAEVTIKGSKEEDNDNTEESADNQSLEYRCVDLQNGITMTLPKLFVERIQNMSAKPWTVERRLTNLPQKDFYSMETFCTDVYELVYNDRTVENDTNDCEIFYVPKSYIQNITMKVPIINTEKGNWYAYQAKIFSGGSWTSVKATYLEESGGQYVKFKANSINSFCIKRTPEKERCIITKEGQTFTSTKDTRIQVMFPKSAISTEEEMHFILYPIDHTGMRQRLRNHPEKYNILAMSDCLYVKQSLPKFNYPVSVNLPINENVDNFELVFFHWKENEIQIIDHKSGRKMEKKNECCTLLVDSFSGFCAGLIRVGSLASISPVEIKMNLGLLKQCRILIFIKKTHQAYFTLWVEVVGIEKVEETVRKKVSTLGLIEIPLCRSSDVFLNDEQRIRINVSGNVRSVEAREKLSHTFTFLHAASESYMSFPLKLSRTIGGNPFAVVDFLEDSGRRQRLHIAHFDPEQVAAARAQRIALRDDDVNRPRRTERAHHNLKEFFSDQSMMVLAANIPLSEAHEFGIFLGVKLETLTRIYNETKGYMNVKIFHLRILKEWLSIEKSPDRFNVLLRALKNCELHRLADQVELAFEEGRQLKMEDIE